MSKKNTESKLAELPNPETSPAVVAARTRYDELGAKLSAIRHERKELERDIGAKGGESYEDLEAKLLAHGHDTEKLNRLRELRRTEHVTEKAVVILRHEHSKALDTAKREMTAFAREEVFLPAARAAVKDWLAAVKKIEQFRRLVSDVQDRGLGAGTHSPFNGRVPLSLADRDAFSAFTAELIAEGFTDRDTINAAFPETV